ncbi:MAG: hypothetical protein WBG37_22210, partial [Desulfobacterales bacterium]
GAAVPVAPAGGEGHDLVRGEARAFKADQVVARLAGRGAGLDVVAPLGGDLQVDESGEAAPCPVV